MQLPMLNTQLIEPPVWREDGALEVHSVFATIQGEGPFAGQSSIFVRLAGCNLQCPACDTEYTSFRMLHNPSELLKVAEAVRQDRKINLIVITGGEPFRQNLLPFVRHVLALDRCNLQIETNGAIFPEKWTDSPYVTVVCSPKTPKVSPKIRYHNTYWKYVVQAGNIDPDDGLPSTTLGNSWGVARPRNLKSGSVRSKVYVQPLDEQDPIKNKENEKAAIASCMRFGYRLSYQMHKALGLE